MNGDPVCRRILIYAGISGALAVSLSAFDAHGLEAFLKRQYASTLSAQPTGELSPESAAHLAKRKGQFSTACRLHLGHSLALLALAAIPYGSSRSRQWVSRLLLAGIVLFSGGLYVLVSADDPRLGRVVPFGGLCWILGWLSLIFVARSAKSA